MKLFNKQLQQKFSAGLMVTLSSCGLFLAANYSQIKADSVKEQTATSYVEKESESSSSQQSKTSSSQSVAQDDQTVKSSTSQSSQSAKENTESSSSSSDTSEEKKQSDEETDEDQSLTTAGQMAGLNHMGGQTSAGQVSSLLRDIPSIDIWTIGDKSRPTVTTVDVASYQSGMTQANFNKLASLGVKTVIVKATESNSYTNPFALQQMKYAANAGMNVALYQFATYKNANEAKAEANYLNKWLQKNNVNSNILILSDIESDYVTVPSVAQNMQVFQTTLSNAGYSNHGFYTSKDYKYRSQLTAVNGAKRGWIAQYPFKPAHNNLWNSEFAAWQFSPNAHLPGYNGALDVSYDYTGFLSQGAGSQPFGNKPVNKPSKPNKPAKPSKNPNSSVKSPYKLKKSHGQTYAYKNGKKVRGWVSIGQRKYYFRSGDGVMLRNWQTINGRTYYFRKNDGVMLRSWQKIGTKTYYFYKDGKMLRNWQTINGKTYYFYKDGKMLRNWQNIGGKRYYFYKDGKLLRDYQIINGKGYQFNKVTGALIK